jgi:hypothetical protein
VTTLITLPIWERFTERFERLVRGAGDMDSLWGDVSGLGHSSRQEELFKRLNGSQPSECPRLYPC